MTDIFNLPSFVSWLETQPQETKVNFMSCTKCVVATYVAAHMSREEYMKHPKSLHNVFDKYDLDLYVEVCYKNTYSEVLESARRLLDEDVERT